MTTRPRRGWRERAEEGIARAHRVGCPSSADRKPGRRCQCGYEFKAPGVTPGSVRTITYYGTLKQVRAERRRLLSEGRPVATDGTVTTVTLTDFCADVFSARVATWAANTMRLREDDYVERIAPELGALPLAEVTRARIEVWLANLVATGASHRMVQGTVATLRVILGAGYEWGMLDENPARRLRLPKRDPNDIEAVERVLDHAQLEALFAAAGTLRTETMIRACGEAALRRGEVVGLKWPNVEGRERRLYVRRQVIQERLEEGGHRKVETPPKGGRSRRVAISAAFADRLGAWYEESILDGGGDATGFVWPGRSGGAMHDRSLAQALERACFTANLTRGKGEKKRALVSPHRLRHSCASVMLMSGVPITVVSAQLGHANPAITARIYSHLIDDRDLDIAAGVFERTDSGGHSGGAAPRPEKALS